MHPLQNDMCTSPVHPFISHGTGIENRVGEVQAQGGLGWGGAELVGRGGTGRDGTVATVVKMSLLGLGSGFSIYI